MKDIKSNSKFTAEENFVFLATLVGAVMFIAGMAVLFRTGGALVAGGLFLLAGALRSRSW